jgi:hypothetical protein
MQNLSHTVAVRVLLFLGVLFLLSILSNITLGKIRGKSLPEIPATGGDFLSLEPMIDLTKLVFNGDRNMVRGVYSPSVMSYPVIQQPPGNPAMVSDEPDIVT